MWLGRGASPLTRRVRTGPSSSLPSRRSARLFSEVGRRFAALVQKGGQGDDGKAGEKDPFAAIYARDYGFWTQLLFTQPAACYLSRCVPETGEIRGGFVLNVGSSKEKVAKLLEEYRQIAKDRVRKTQFGSDGVLFRSEDGKTQVKWVVHQDYLIVSAGDEPLDAIIQRMSGREPKWLSDVRKEIPIERRGVVARLDCRAMLAGLAQDDDSRRQIRQAILALPRSIVLATGLDGEDFVSRIHVELDPITAQIIHSLAGRPLKAEDLAPIPGDATLAMALRADPAYLLTLYEQVAALIDDGARKMEIRSWSTRRLPARPRTGCPGSTMQRAGSWHRPWTTHGRSIAPQWKEGCYSRG